MTQTLPTLAHTQLAIEAAEREICALRERLDLCLRGMAPDSAGLSFYREMISLQEELLMDWRALSAQPERTISST
jgi:hypothetical protein